MTAAGKGQGVMNYPTDLDGMRFEKDKVAKAGYLIFDRPPMNVISFQGRSQIAEIIAASGGTVRIAHLVGLTRAKEMIMLGRRISAREAFGWGLLTEIVTDDK